MSVGKINETSIEQGIERILIDVRGAKNTLTILENYNYAYNITERQQVNKKTRGAVLTAPDDKSHDFIITAMLNAGFNTKIFHDKPSALKWLEEPVP